MENLEIDTLLLSGGAMKCVSILGALKFLFKENIIKPSLENIKDIYFVSGSSVYMTPLLIGFSLDCTIDLFKKIDYKTMYDSSKEMKIQNLFDKFGLKDITEFKFTMEAILRSKDIDVNITLKEFYELTKKNIHFRVININEERNDYLNKDNSPDLKYMDAVCMTCCIPILFEPVEYNGCKYIDGGVNNNFPYEVLINNKNCLGINILQSSISLCNTSCCDTEINDLSQYLYKIYNIYGAPPISEKSINHIKLLINGTGVDFNKFSSIIDETLLIGYNTTKEHFSNFQKHNDSSPQENEDQINDTIKEKQ